MSVLSAGCLFFFLFWSQRNVNPDVDFVNEFEKIENNFSLCVVLCGVLKKEVGVQTDCVCFLLCSVDLHGFALGKECRAGIHGFHGSAVADDDLPRDLPRGVEQGGDRHDVVADHGAGADVADGHHDGLGELQGLPGPAQRGQQQSHDAHLEECQGHLEKKII